MVIDDTSMRFKMVDSLRDVMQVRRLRNSCRLDLTNCQDHIGFVRQLRWYFSNYAKARRDATYRLYLLYDRDGSPVGYGALHLRNKQLLITECVGPQYRGRGHGLRILQSLMQIAAAEKRDLIAEIWGSNSPSLALHKKTGFEFESAETKDGKELHRYRLRFEGFAG